MFRHSALEPVLEWCQLNGALLEAETHILRQNLQNPPEDETDLDFAIRVYIWICLDLLKRPIQILSMPKKALVVQKDGQYFLKVPPAKNQCGQKPKMWKITKNLAEEIQRYSQRNSISDLQNRFNRLIVIPGRNKRFLEWTKHGQVDNQTAKCKMKDWSRRKKIPNLRGNNQILNLTAYRLRHTGATHMAKQGRSAEEIQEVLEHDSIEAAKHYIDCIASELAPVFENGNARLGDAFRFLKDSYFFKGKIIDSAENSKSPINIPIVEKTDGMAIVGSCGANGNCSKHPLWACYDGCPHFLAWSDGPHEKALEFVKNEYKRWSEAEGGTTRSKSLKDFDRLYLAISQCLEKINSS